MRRKEFRQRNKDLFKSHQQPSPSQAEGSGFISYSSHLRKKEEQEMKVLQKIDYNYSQFPAKKNDNEIFLLMKQKGRDETQTQKVIERSNLGKSRYGNTLNSNGSKKTLVKSRGNIGNEIHAGQNSSPKNTQHYQEIDTSAVVIKGRLIYLKQQTGQIPSNDHLLYLLKQNNISNKEYLTGNQQQILERISKNESMKENEIIKDYILRNMSQQTNGEVVIMDRFHEIKDKLFD